MSDSTVRANRVVWESASQKHVVAYEALLAEARDGSALTHAESRLLGPIRARRPRVVHLQTGHGLDDIALAKAGVGVGIGIDSWAAAERCHRPRY